MRILCNIWQNSLLFLELSFNFSYLPLGQNWIQFRPFLVSTLNYGYIEYIPCISNEIELTETDGRDVFVDKKLAIMTLGLCHLPIIDV